MLQSPFTFDSSKRRNRGLLNTSRSTQTQAQAQTQTQAQTQAQSATTPRTPETVDIRPLYTCNLHLHPPTPTVTQLLDTPPSSSIRKPKRQRTMNTTPANLSPTNTGSSSRLRLNSNPNSSSSSSSSSSSTSRLDTWSRTIAATATIINTRAIQEAAPMLIPMSTPESFSTPSVEASIESNLRLIQLKLNTLEASSVKSDIERILRTTINELTNERARRKQLPRRLYTEFMVSDDEDEEGDEEQQVVDEESRRADFSFETPRDQILSRSMTVPPPIVDTPRPGPICRRLFDSDYEEEDVAEGERWRGRGRGRAAAAAAAAAGEGDEEELEEELPCFILSNLQQSSVS
ncbi:hypothetical protein KGF56_000650 [Candida oxycetoniae]|uniref:Uncharacterized protein n=1 Tax=Candida oxycetoniae TaxID=497107 RepID=A0AAI9WZS7_9ASCO|nr:uncharacterized protein KGF56_000650 [Candida oxycetoniae]KAI3406518.2 hypothetical protein KGF56_000650 [Candida oxycetoniae]